MSLVIAATAAILLVQPVCSWNRPGVDRYRGTPAAALANYRDIPAADRAVLARRMAAGVPDDTVQISRTAIAGRFAYDGRITNMHFGTRRMCRTVTRAQWASDRREPGAVYCVHDECVLVPAVCGNVSRVRRIGTSGGGMPGSTGGAPVLPVELELAPPAPVPDYPTVPSGGAPLPPWAGPGMPSAPAPLPGYPGPGRGGPLAPVPEPSTWAMLLAGTALLAARVWRQSRPGHRPGGRP